MIPISADDFGDVTMRFARKAFYHSAVMGIDPDSAARSIAKLVERDIVAAFPDMMVQERLVAGARWAIADAAARVVAAADAPNLPVTDKMTSLVRESVEAARRELRDEYLVRATALIAVLRAVGPIDDEFTMFVVYRSLAKAVNDAVSASA